MNTNQRLISFDLKAEMCFLKKPDINDGIYLTYNMLHKPALLGILGAIAGMKGYKENGVLPEYYERLNHLKVGIQPGEESDKGNFTKDIVSYNNSTGFASNEEGGNLIVIEQIMIKPSYRCFLLLNLDNDDEKTLYDNILSYKAEFLPYLGKNDFSAWWTDVREYDSFDKFDFSHDYKIASIFVKTEAISGYVARTMSMFSLESKKFPFLYFEKLPIDLEGKDKNGKRLYQYSYADFVYSNASFKGEMNMSKAGEFYQIDEERIIQLY